MNYVYEICGRKYPVVGYVSTKQTGRVPVVNMPMMSDERWKELAREAASEPESMRREAEV